jgi:hypothetical protein
MPKKLTPNQKTFYELSKPINIAIQKNTELVTALKSFGW